MVELIFFFFSLSPWPNPRACVTLLTGIHLQPLKRKFRVLTSAPPGKPTLTTLCKTALLIVTLKL